MVEVDSGSIQLFQPTEPTANNIVERISRLRTLLTNLKQSKVNTVLIRMQSGKKSSAPDLKEEE